MKKISLLFITFLILISAALAQNKIAIFDPQDKNNTGYKSVVREILSTSLTKSTFYKPVERALIDKVLEEYKYQTLGLVNDGEVIELGKQIGADFVCVSMIEKMGTNFFVTAKIVNVNTASVEAQSYVKTKDGENDLFEKLEELANSLIGIKPTASSSGKTTSSNSNSSSYAVSVGGVSFKMINVQGGSFEMGSNTEDDEKPIHSVNVSDFSIAEFEVTQELWEAVMGTSIRTQRDKASSSYSIYGEGANYPMYYVSYNEVQDFINELNRRTGKSFRLPSEAEWEFAARGGNNSKGFQYAGGNNLSDVAWYDANSVSNTHQVGLKRSNELGLYDMSGNVWEWCADWYGNYSSSKQTDPQGANSGSDRVVRGGGWFSGASGCRVAFRSYFSPGFRDYILGFRLAHSSY